jgi:DNA polymerase III subunit delta'
MWKNVIGQDGVKDKLISVFNSGKIPHAYLFSGVSGTGKDAAAIEFAKLLNCTNVKNGTDACDECENCRKVSSLRSEYLQLICALPAGKSDETDSNPVEKLAAADFDIYMEQISLKSENPYHHISLPNANNIRINSIRDLVSKIYLSLPAGFKKIFLVSEAHKMRQEAANALLKVLEEPPKNSVIILTTSKLNSLPQTIIGRCQNIYFESLTVSQIQNKLSETTDYTKKQTEIASKLSFGSYTRAVELLEMGIEEIRNAAIQYMVSLLKGDYAEMVLISRTITARNDRDKTKYFLFFLNIWFRDLLNTRYERFSEIANVDMEERLKKLNSNYPEADIYSIISSIEESERLINQNVQLTLILINLSFKLKQFIK